MPDRTFLDWPFFEDRHRELGTALEDWAGAHLPVDHGDLDAACRELVAALGKAGFLRHSGGETLDVRSLCLIRETLARHDGLADFAFAMQGLGMGARVAVRFGPSSGPGWSGPAAGAAISAFALSEPAQRVGRGQYHHHGARGWQRIRAGRRKDLDFEWRHRRCLHGFRAHRRSAGREGAVGVPGAGRYAGIADRRDASR